MGQESGKYGASAFHVVLTLNVKIKSCGTVSDGHILFFRAVQNREIALASQYVLGTAVDSNFSFYELLIMNDALVTDIATKIFDEQIFQNWKVYSIAILISVIAGAAGNFVGPYLRKRGETLATRSDFDEIKRQLHDTTELAKKIDLRLSHEDWTRREYKLLRRTKLEEMMTAVLDSEEWMDRSIRH